MKRILIFSGTTEGRKLAELLADADVPAVVCVATEYGSQVMPLLAGIELHQGRLNRQEMQELMEPEAFWAVVDATHPFATEVSANIRQSALAQQLPCLRLQRNTDADSQSPAQPCLTFATNEACAEALLTTTGNILLTTGSKELAVYCKEESLRERLFVRVLPSEESIALCRKQGLSGKQILAMQGPFSEEMNTALLRQYQISHLVTKESGNTGGFPEKTAAAARLGTSLYIIGNPEKQDGLSFAEVCEKLEGLTGRSICRSNTLHISLVGVGMGHPDTLTVAAKKKISEADYLFGAGRLLSGVNAWNTGKAGRRAYASYLAEEILPVMEEILRDSRKSGSGAAEAVILFSGDSGFYSGAQKLYEKLADWKSEKKEDISLRIYPGISSVSYFAAVCGVSWQDAKILSIHGKGEQRNWEAEVLAAVRYQKKVFLIVSGAKDVRAVGTLLRENNLTGCRILLGRQLSYEEEEVTACTPDDCEQITREGLYILMVLNESCSEKYLAPLRSDDAFIRGKVPMTKEEIRELAVCKLHLTKQAVVYDIGSGTGSVAMEIAERSAHIRVYAVEQKPEGIDLIRQNQIQCCLPNIEVIQGTAPDVLAELPAPTHAFIGGSGGNLAEILCVLYQKNPAMRIVITAVTLETVSELTTLLKKLPVVHDEMIHLQVSRAKKAGSCHLMQAENPVYICSFDFAKERV